ncbi:hypothetical protein [uncultured Formosa sp.]|uniref:hypothetical protein n=1 Tax=uncultured Formosa sp. TaxID=255435 RepID=UPI0026225D1A|nr:hypothetical protein [uncultured Formosa sp.]
MMNCSKSNDNLSFIFNLKQSITSEYNTNKINIHINEDADNINLQIFITDPKFNNYSVQEKRDMAKTIKKFTAKNEMKTFKTKTGELIFKNETNNIIFKTTDSESYKMY